MDDNKIGHGGARNQHLFDAGPNSQADSFLRSESPLDQQFRLYRELKKEIERNSTDRVRYVDSELYLRNRQHPRSPAASGSSEVQSTTLNVGTLPAGKTQPSTSPGQQAVAGDGDADSPDKSGRVNKNCQVCLIREVRKDLMNINRMVQEHNEQISKLKAKCLRSYFERQMLD